MNASQGGNTLTGAQSLGGTVTSTMKQHFAKRLSGAQSIDGGPQTGPKEHELNYFAFEAQMRQHLRELIDPYMQKALADREDVQETKRLLTNVSKRVYDLEHFVQKGEDIHTVFDGIDKRFGEMNIETNLLKRQVEEENKRIKEKAEESAQRMVAMQGTLETYASQIRAFQIDINKFYETIHSQRTELQDLHTDFKARIDSDMSHLSQKSIDFDTRLSLSDTRLDTVSGNVEMLLKMTETHDLRLSQMESDVKKLEKGKVNVELYNVNQEKINEKFVEQDYCLGDLNNNMMASDNFMEKYQPIKFLTMMIECLSTVMDKKKVQKLQDWSENKHKELQEHVVNDNGVPFGTKHKKEAGAELVSGSASVVMQMKQESMTELTMEGIKGAKKNSKDQQLRIPINQVNESSGANQMYEDQTFRLRFGNGGNTFGSDMSPDAGARQGGFVGSLIGFNELDSEVADVIRGLVKDVKSLLLESESLRALYRDLQGLSRARVDHDLLTMKSEVRQGVRSLIEVCDNLQTLFEKECQERKQDQSNFSTAIDEAQTQIKRLSEQSDKLIEGVVNVKDLAVVLMENSLIEQALDNHKLFKNNPKRSQTPGPNFQANLNPRLAIRQQSSGSMKVTDQKPEVVRVPHQTISNTPLKQSGNLDSHQQLQLTNFEFPQSKSTILAKRTGEASVSHNNSIFEDYPGASQSVNTSISNNKYTGNSHRRVGSQSALGQQKQQMSLFNISSAKINDTPQTATPGMRKNTKLNTSNQSLTPNIDPPFIGNFTSDDQLPMLYRHQLFKREHLILLRGIILQRAWGMLSTKIPFNRQSTLRDTHPEQEDITAKLFKIAVKELGLSQNSHVLQAKEMSGSESQNTLMRKSLNVLDQNVNASNISLKTSATFQIPGQASDVFVQQQDLQILQELQNHTQLQQRGQLNQSSGHNTMAGPTTDVSPIKSPSYQNLDQFGKRSMTAFVSNQKQMLRLINQETGLQSHK